MSRTPPPKLPPLSLSQLVAIESEDERERVVAMRKRAIFNIDSTCVKCIEHFTPVSHKGAKLFVFSISDNEHYYFNVDRAYEIAERDHARLDNFALKDMERALENTDFDMAHMFHIPREAVMQPIMFVTIPGRGTHTIIDGSHRMKLLTLLRVRAVGYILNESQSQEALFTPQDWAKGRQVLTNLGVTFD